MAAGRTYTPIATVTLNSTASNIDFNSIPSTYTDLVVVGNINFTGSASYLYFVPNALSGVLSWTGIEGNGSTVASARYTNRSDIYIGDWNGSSGTGMATFILHLNNYSNTTTYKTSLSRFSKADNYVVEMVGLARTTNAISSLSFVTSSNSFNIGTQITLYGIAAA